MGVDGYLACERCKVMFQIGRFFKNHMYDPDEVKMFINQHPYTDGCTLVYVSDFDEDRFGVYTDYEDTEQYKLCKRKLEP